jgi:hypothetical protein
LDHGYGNFRRSVDDGDTVFAHGVRRVEVGVGLAVDSVDTVVDFVTVVRVVEVVERECAAGNADQ